MTGNTGNNQIGERLGGFVLLDVIGSGGMGVVYRAQELSTGRQVAVKTLPPDMVDSEARRKRFDREIQAATRLSHPNIVSVVDADAFADTPFLVMEYVQGLSLADEVLTNGPLSVSAALRCVHQAASGLQHAHENGVIHRDVKPSNLLLDEDSQVKVADLGLAVVESQAASELSQTNLTGELTLGTICFMAPEQSADSSQADVRSDMYSLGATLHYLLTGRPPFSEDTGIKTMLAHHEQPTPCLQDTRGDVPDSLEAIFQRMMARNPDDRVATMALLIESLQQVDPGDTVTMMKAETLPLRASDEPTQAQKTSEVSRAADSVCWRTRARRLSLVAASVFLCGFAIYAVSDPAADHQPEDLSGTPLREVSPQDEAFLAERGATVELRSDDSIDDEPVLEKPPTNSQQAAIDPAVELPDRTSTASPPPRAVTPFNLETAKQHQQAWSVHLGMPVAFENSIGMQLALIPPSEFRMGYGDAVVARFLRQYRDEGIDTTSLEKRFASSQPQHEVVLTHPYYFGCYPVTVSQFRSFVAVTGHTTDAERSSRGGQYDGQTSPDFNWKSPGFEQSDDHPVVQITRSDAEAFCQWLTEQEGRRYVIPTEARWECACRSGSQDAWHFGNRPGRLSTYSGSPRSTQPHTIPVGLKQPNAFGIYDLYGTPYEFVLGAAKYTPERQIDPGDYNPATPVTTRGYPKLGTAWRRRSSTSSRPPESQLTFRVAIVGDLQRSVKKPSLPPEINHLLDDLRRGVERIGTELSQ